VPVDNPTNTRAVTIWSNFDRDAIIADFFQTVDEYVLSPWQHPPA
jgi:hypothetical protein